MGERDVRRTEQGHAIDAELLRSFIRSALEHDAVADEVCALLFAHVMERRYHPSVVAASLRPLIDDLLEAATAEDWAAITDQLATDAREVLCEETSPTMTNPTEKDDARSTSRASTTMRYETADEAARHFRQIRRKGLLPLTVGLRQADALDTPLRRVTSGQLVVTSDPGPGGWVVPPAVESDDPIERLAALSREQRDRGERG